MAGAGALVKPSSHLKSLIRQEVDAGSTRYRRAQARRGRAADRKGLFDRA